MTIQPGIDIGRYHILEQLGEGGMAVVYKAYDTHVEREVALKVIRPGQQDQAKILKRFEREAKALAKFNHPNIVPILDYGEYEGNLFLVMPYFPGGTLKQSLGRVMPYEEAARLLAPIADALAYAHKMHFIHRDVKPSNILITESGKPLLSDFGIAKIVEGEETTELTATNVGIGTPEYMSPEQALGKPYNYKVDMYALGVVLYELVTGRKPYMADTPVAVLVKHASEPLPRPREINPKLPDEVEKMLFKALAKDPKDRYASMQEFSQAMDYILAGARRTGEEEREPEQIPTKNMEDFTRDETHAPEKIKGIPGWIWAAAGLGLVTLIVVFFAFSGGSSTKLGSPSLATNEVSATVVPTITQDPTSTIVPTPILSIGSTKISDKDGMTLMYVPAGEFEMGSNNGESNEKPVHTVSLDAFWIDKTEITNAQYRLCVEAGVCAKPDGEHYADSNYADHAVVYVNWDDANKYCLWAGRRLPTEAEWEKAARGTDGRTYPWGNTEPNANLLNYNLNIEDTTKVGRYLDGASPYGVLDMAGNAWEWVVDWYSESYYNQSPSSNPLGPSTGSYRGLRGGSVASDLGDVRSAYRDRYFSVYRYDFIGFRCALPQ